jgi:hypothetical protein
VWLRHPDTGLQERQAVEVIAGKIVTLNIEWREQRK